MTQLQAERVVLEDLANRKQTWRQARRRSLARSQREEPLTMRRLRVWLQKRDVTTARRSMGSS
jgi:hypothetical protein